MKITSKPFFLEFIRPFALAHGTRTGTNLVFVRLEHEDITTYGEASLPPYRKETTESVQKFILEAEQDFDSSILKNPFENKSKIPFDISQPAASHALLTSILSWYAYKEKKSLSFYFKQNNHAPSLTLTVTKNDFNFLDEKLQLQSHFSHFKLKLTGEDDDIEFVKAIRKKTDIPFCLDCNQGYFKKENALKLVSELEKLNITILEQPLKDFDHEGHFWMKQRSSIPIIADESICTLEDLKQFYDAYSGVNIKLIKCGGLFQAQEMIDFSRAKNMLTLIGCMSESSLGVASASVISSQCDMADLDSPYLNKNNPFKGFVIKNGKIQIEGEFGVGVEGKF